MFRRLAATADVFKNTAHLRESIQYFQALDLCKRVQIGCKNERRTPPHVQRGNGIAISCPWQNKFPRNFNVVGSWMTAVRTVVNNKVEDSEGGE